MTVTQIMEQVNRLTLQERRDLIELLSASIQQSAEPEKHSILELAGLGATVWKDVDPQEYVNQLRAEWDDRS
ncbi:MAG: hypothetical protein RLP44_10510 [Aggregatilineales bacterium]